MCFYTISNRNICVSKCKVASSFARSEGFARRQSFTQPFINVISHLDVFDPMHHVPVYLADQRPTILYIFLNLAVKHLFSGDY
jgi:hypothetical protein